MILYNYHGLKIMNYINLFDMKLNSKLFKLFPIPLKIELNRNISIVVIHLTFWLHTIYKRGMFISLQFQVSFYIT